MNRVLKVVLGLVVAAAVVWVLFSYVFPWVDRNLIADPTLEAAPGPVGLEPAATST
jgi:hypothetical protein